MKHDRIQLRIVAHLGKPIEDEALEALATVIGQSIGEFLAVTGHETQGVEVHVHGLHTEPGGHLH